MDVTIQSSVKSGNKYVIMCQAEFDAKDLTSDECVRLVKQAFAGITPNSTKLASVKISEVQAAINKQIGVSPLTFAQYADR
jgi:hypothetical protein